MARKEVGGSATFIKPGDLKKGDCIEGTFVETKPSSNYKDQNVHYIQTDDKGLVGVNGSGQLDFKMTTIAPGEYIYLTYEGSKVLEKGPFKGKSAHSWKLEIDDEADSAPSAKKPAGFASEEEIPF